MLDLNLYFCDNPECVHYGKKAQGNIVRCGTYGPHHRQLLQCSACKARFSETRNTAFFGSKYPPETINRIICSVAQGNGIRATATTLGLSKDAVDHIVLKAGEHCAKVLANLLQTLNLEQCQLDELWSFVQKKRLFPPRTNDNNMGRSGSGSPSIP